ncbi:MAG: ABC transporter ATP-binding protein [Clostridia bacterium]|nr:ABC transporter ATP-binding protein [Clostridia bacterium]
MKNLNYYLKKVKIQFILICVFSIISSIATIVAPVYIGNIVEKVIPIYNKSVVSEIGILVVIYIILFVSNLLLNHYLISFASKISYNIRLDLYKKINCLSVAYLDKVRFGDTINNFTIDVENVSTGLIQAISKITGGIITIIISVVIMLTINVKMAFVLIGVAPIMYIVSRYVGTNTSKLFKERANLVSELNGYTEEQISGIKTIKNFNDEAESLKRFKEKNTQLRSVGIKAQFYSSLTNPSTRLITNIAYIAVAIFGLSLIKSDNGLSLGNLTTFLVYTNVFTRPFNEITSVISELQTAGASGKRIFKFLNENEEDLSGENQLVDFKGKIEFKDVSFSYNGKKKVFQNFNFVVNPKEHVAIVGKTGAGKTTIANLLLRFYEIDSGEILIDGVNIRNIGKNQLRRNIGIVLQDTKLFNGTIRENIAYGKQNASMEEIVNAAKMARAHDFIERLPQGYDTYVEGENVLSVGEVQLINIARIMLSKPPILILDEATSNIDAVTEQKISTAFTELVKDSTSFVIAHKTKTIKDADRIFSL